MVPQLMLAKPTKLPRDVAARRLTANGSHVAEIKLDGVRACATIDGDRVKLTNRNGVDITHRYPDVVTKLSSLGITAVVDGEIIVMDPAGRPDFHLALKRDAQSDPRKAAALARITPARFVAFDILSLSDRDTRRLIYDQRRELLQGLGLDVNVASGDGQMMWDYVVANELEGLVLKRRDSTYVGRRSDAWQKVKRLSRITALVNGFDPGKGHRAATFGALHLVLIGEGTQLVPIGTVGSGFSNTDCRLIRDRLDRGDHPIIVEVECMGASPDGKLRQPVFRGVRTDVQLTDCTLSQLSAH